MKYTPPKPKRPRPVQLSEVVVTASRIRPLTQEKVNLYPSGQVDKRRVDSLKRADPKMSKLIGNPSRRHQNSQAEYGTEASDMIKRLLK